MTGTTNVDESTDITESQKDDVTDAMDISEAKLKTEPKFTLEKEAVTPKLEVRESFASIGHYLHCVAKKLLALKCN